MVLECLEGEGLSAAAYPDLWKGPGLLDDPKGPVAERSGLQWYVGPADGNEGMGIVAVNADGSLNENVAYSGDCVEKKKKCYELAEEKGLAAPFYVKCDVLKNGEGIDGTLDGIICELMTGIAEALGGGEDGMGTSLMTSAFIPFIALYEKFRYPFWALVAFQVKKYIDSQN